MIYFDNAATTLPNKEVLSCYNEASISLFANTSSIHSLGMKNSIELNRAKNNLLNILNLSKNDYEVVITSGATEANNLALKGFLLGNKRYKRIITSKLEHSSILETIKKLDSDIEVVYIKIKSNGEIDYDNLKEVIDKNNVPSIVCMMGVNNEVGSINNLKLIREIIKDNILFSDLVQTISKENIDLKLLDMFTFTSHKINGLKGCGVLIKKKKIKLSPIIYGGNQENGLRSGTVDFPSFYAFCKACEISIKNSNESYKKVKEINKFLYDELNNMKDEVVINSSLDSSPYILNFSLLNKKASVVVEALSMKEIYVSSVSACYSKSNAISYVLKEMGKDDNLSLNVIRLSFNESNTLEEAKIFIKEFKEIIKSIKG